MNTELSNNKKSHWVADSDIPADSRNTGSRITGYRQSGAVLPIAIFFCLILGAALFTIYNTAQVSRTKRQLTNAADVIAYSTATVAAEGLNYTAYTNRAMVANYQAVGQMTSMWSNITLSDQYWKKNDTLLKAVSDIAKYIPYIGEVVAPLLTGIANFGTTWEKILDKVRVLGQVVANAGSAVESVTNHIIYGAQQVHLATTMYTLGKIQNELIAANAPKASLIPSTIAYQTLKSIGDFVSMLEWHTPPKEFYGNRDMTTKIGKDGKPEGNANLIHFMMTDVMFTFVTAVNGRQMFPNAAGLWMFDGCGLNGKLTGATSGLTGDAGLSSLFPAMGGLPADQLVSGVIEGIGTLMGEFFGTVACPLLGLQRSGGTRTMQNKDLSYSWATFDAIGAKILNIDALSVPLAGAVTMSHTSANKARGANNIPLDLTNWIEQVIDRPQPGWVAGGIPDGDAQGDAYPGSDTDRFGAITEKKRIWGEGVAGEDCVYITLPTGRLWEPRINGSCGTLAPGDAKKYHNRGIFSMMRKDAERAMDGQASATNAAEAVTNAIMAPLEGTLDTLEQTISSVGGRQGPFVPDSDGGNASFNVRGGMVSGLPATDAALASPTPDSGQAEAALAAMTAQGDAFSGFTSGVAGNMRSAFQSMFSGNLLDGGATSGTTGGVDGFLKFVLNFLGLSDVIDLLEARTSRGVETLYQKKGLGGYVAADMGLPATHQNFGSGNTQFGPWGMWEVRGARGYGSLYKAGANVRDTGMFTQTIEGQQAALADMGPTFLTGLQQSLDDTPTANVKHFSPADEHLDPTKDTSLHMADYDAASGQNYIRSLSKARVYYRNPAERWTTRAQIVSHANLFSPFWNVKLEGLNYGEKILFAILNGNGTSGGGGGGGGGTPSPFVPHV